MLYARLAAVIVVVAVLPIVSVAVASIIAALEGCRLDEGTVHPCLVLGLDVGSILYMLGVLGWMALATVPAGLLMLGLLAVIMVIHLGWRLYARRGIAAK